MSYPQNPDTFALWVHQPAREYDRTMEPPRFHAENFEDKITLLFSGDGRDDSIEIRQNAEVYMGSLQAGESYNWKPNVILPNLWIQLIEGEISVNDHKLKKADGLGIEDVKEELRFSATSQSKFLVFKLV